MGYEKRAAVVAAVGIPAGIVEGRAGFILVNKGDIAHRLVGTATGIKQAKAVERSDWSVREPHIGASAIEPGYRKNAI
jgi:hypothetical protein